LAERSVDGWSEASTLVTDRWPGRVKRIIVFDEFQWTAWASPELPSVLQELWTGRGRRPATGSDDATTGTFPKR
jgi:hypothetical protein